MEEGQGHEDSMRTQREQVPVLAKLFSEGRVGSLQNLAIHGPDTIEDAAISVTDAQDEQTCCGDKDGGRDDRLNEHVVTVHRHSEPVHDSRMRSLYGCLPGRPSRSVRIEKAREEESAMIASGSLRDTMRIALTALLVACVFLDWFSEPAQSRHIYLARALIEEGTTSISRFIADPTATADIAFVPHKDGRREFVAGTYPGVSFAVTAVAIIGPYSWHALPNAGRAFFKQVYDDWLITLSILFVTAPLLALAAAGMHRFAIASNVDARAATIWTLSFALGTPLVYYAARLHESSFVAAGNTLILMLVARPAEMNKARWFLIGLALGILDLLNPLAALVAGSALLALVGARALFKASGWIAAGLFAPELLLRGYLASVFGSPLASPYNFLLAHGIGHVWASRGLGGMIQEMIRVIPEVGWGLTFGIRGLFVFAPITLLGLTICVLRVGRDPFARAALVATAVNASVIWTFVHGVWAGGTSWGPRYLLPCLPWIFAGAVRSGRVPGLGAFAVLSIFVTFLGLQFGPAEGLAGHLGYFALSGPTTPFTRYAAHLIETVWVPAKLAVSMSPSTSGQYFAYTHITGFGTLLLFAGVLGWIWKPSPRGAGRASGS